MKYINIKFDPALILSNSKRTGGFYSEEPSPTFWNNFIQKELWFATYKDMLLEYDVESCLYMSNDTEVDFSSISNLRTVVDYPTIEGGASYFEVYYGSEIIARGTARRKTYNVENQPVLKREFVKK